MEITTKKNFRAFRDGSITNRFILADDGSVKAWDSIAGHYTSLHALSRRQIAMIRAVA